MIYPVPQQNFAQQNILSEASDERVANLKQFLADAPHKMNNAQQGDMYRYPLLDSNEYVTCVYWNGEYLMSGTDIVRIVQYRFRCRGVSVPRPKKLEEGIFSDLRNLKPGHDAVLEEPRSELLKFLYEKECIRTQKKQKVFYWYKIPHDNLYHDAMERELRRLHNLDNMTMLCQHLFMSQQHPVEMQPNGGYGQMQMMLPQAQMQPQQQMYYMHGSTPTMAPMMPMPEPFKQSRPEMLGIEPMMVSDSMLGNMPMPIPNHQADLARASNEKLIMSLFNHEDFLKELDTKDF